MLYSSLASLIPQFDSCTRQRLRGYVVSSLSTSIIHCTSTTMASQEDQKPSAPTTKASYPHSKHGTDIRHSRAEGRENSRYEGKRDRKGPEGEGRRDHRRDRGNGESKDIQSRVKKTRDVGRAEWAYVKQIASSIALALIAEGVSQLTEERAMTSKLRNDRR